MSYYPRHQGSPPPPDVPPFQGTPGASTFQPPPSESGSGLEIEDGTGTVAPTEPAIMFAGSTIMDDPSNNRIIVTLPGSGGGVVAFEGATADQTVGVGTYIDISAFSFDHIGLIFPGTPGVFQVPPSPQALYDMQLTVCILDAPYPAGVAPTDLMRMRLAFREPASTFADSQGDTIAPASELYAIGGGLAPGGLPCILQNVVVLGGQSMGCKAKVTNLTTGANIPIGSVRVILGMIQVH